MRQLVVSAILGTALVAVTAAPAAAQNNELGGGVSFQEWNSDFAESRGFGIDFARAIWRNDNHQLSIIGDYARNRFSNEETDQSFLGGVRVKLMRMKRVSIFAQGTAGVMRWSEDDGGSGTDPMFGGGAGVQIRLTNRVDAKAQMDFWRVDGDNVNRLLAGIVLKLGQQ